MPDPGVLLEAAANAAAAVLILAGCCSLGHALIPARLQPPRRVHRFLIGLSAGALAAGWTTWLAGTISTRLIAPLGLLLLLGAVLGARRTAVSARAAARYLAALARANPAAAALLAALLLALVPQLCVPPIDSDGLRYHLALPKLYLLAGRIFHDAVTLGSTYPQGVEMLNLLGMMVAGGGSAKFLHAGFFVAGLASIACLVHRDRRTRPAAMLAAAFLAASPVALVPAATAFVDDAAMFHVATALLLLRGGRWSPLLVGVAAAGALFTKITTAPVALGCWLSVAVLSRAGRARALVLAVAPAAVALAPLAIRNVANTGDPFYPVGRVVLGLPTPGLPAAAIASITSLHARSYGPLGIAWGPDPSHVAPDDVTGWHLFLGLVVAPLAAFRPHARILLLPVVAYGLLGAWLHPPTRYLVPLLAALAALLAVACATLHRRVARLAPLIALPSAYLAAHCVVVNFAPLDLLLGRVDRSGFLARSVPGWEAAAAVNALAPRGRIMALDFPAPYYFDFPWIAEGPMCEPPLLTWLRDAGSGADLLDRLRTEGVTHLLVTPGYGGGGPESLLALAESPRERVVLRGLRAALRLVMTVGGVDVYEVLVESPPRPPYAGR